MKSKNWGDVIDIGSKDARYKNYMEFKSYTTFDIDPTFKPNIEGDIEMYSSDKKYDTILMSQCLEHLKRPQIAIKCMAELLKDGGAVICTSPLVFAPHGDDYFRYTEDCLRMMFGTYFSKVQVIPYGNFLSAAWQIFNFHNRFWWFNRFVAWLSRLTFSSKYVPDGYITIAIK